MQRLFRLENLSLALFIFISLVQIYSQIIASDFVNYISKPLIIPSLLAFAFFVAKSQNQKLEIKLLLALLFCWLGDCLLILQKIDANFFIYGLIAFLIGHVFYILINLKSISKINSKDFLAFVPMLMWAIFLLSNIKSGFLVPIFIYSIALCGLYFTGLLARQKFSKNHWVILFIGIILFIASDSMIAINKFIMPFESAGFFIMLTYIIAQFMIVWANIKFLNA